MFIVCFLFGIEMTAKLMWFAKKLSEIPLHLNKNEEGGLAFFVAKKKQYFWKLTLTTVHEEDFGIAQKAADFISTKL